MNITVRAKDQQEAEGLYQKWQESEKCPECKTYDCEHYEIDEDVFHTWERYSDEQLGNDPVTVTYNTLKSAQNEAFSAGVKAVLIQLNDHGIEVPDIIHTLADFKLYTLAPSE